MAKLVYEEASVNSSLEQLGKARDYFSTDSGLSSAIGLTAGMVGLAAMNHKKKNDEDDDIKEDLEESDDVEDYENDYIYDEVEASN